ncbi:MAG TPA: hypothetical protein VLL48_14020, partial [Longimicrobiales bacterium]|nr:hypothetical protein [Longimicrobiales bacterium]
MRARATVSLALGLALALSAPPAEARQSSTHVSLAIGVGSAFDGFGFGLATTRVGHHSYSSFGVGVGTGGIGFVADAAYGGYGIYDDPWGYGRWSRSLPYRIRRSWSAHHASCWDVYGYGFDPFLGFGWGYPYSDAYWHCTGYRPRAYHRSYWNPWYHGGVRGVYVSTYWRDPFWDPWGPYWAYDPWSYYWSGPWYGPRSVWVVNSSWSRPYVGRRVAVARTSPFYAPATGTVYKEDPARGFARAGTGRNATARPGSTPATARGAVPSGTSRPGVAAPPTRRDPGVSTGGAARPSTPSVRGGGATSEPGVR